MKPSLAELLRDFHFVKKRFFPEFDATDQWRIRYIDHDDYGSPLTVELCYHKSKTILIPRGICFADRTDVQASLIHELTHAVLGTGLRGHGEPWRRAMQGHVETAETLYLTDIATRLKQDIKWMGIVFADEAIGEGVYRDLTGVVVRAFVADQISPHTIVERAAKQRGITAGHYLSRYPETERVINETIEFCKEDRLLHKVPKFTNPQFATIVIR